MTESKTTTCIGNDPSCPCQDGDMCHYRGPNAWPIPNVIITLCADCGHEENDHIEEDDCSYCVGEIQDSSSYPHGFDLRLCQCRRFHRK
jgi:hypothetical protein